MVKKASYAYEKECHCRDANSTRAVRASTYNSVYIEKN